MVQAVAVRFRPVGKPYHFAPAEWRDLRVGEHVIVETARGLECGVVVSPIVDIPEEQLAQPLKPVLRPATPEDLARVRENRARAQEALCICREKVEARGLGMNVLDSEYTLDRSRLVFYFTAEARVDFRDLVRDLAATFGTRIELRQIGVRDEAKMVGGLGPCGRVACCASWLCEFMPVSIRMAKEQNLSLNPSKISGLCGRLMCCLRYEAERYQCAKKKEKAEGEAPAEEAPEDGHEI